MKLATMLVFVFLGSLASNVANATDFDFSTKYWFNKIDLECRSGMCDIEVNGKHRASVPYEVNDNIASAFYDGYNLVLDLATGKYEYSKGN